MIKKIREAFLHAVSKAGLLFLLATLIFMVIVITTGMMALTILIQVKLGYLEPRFYRNPEAGLIYIFGLSLVIGSVITGIGSRFAFRHINKLLVAVRKVANGDFNSRIVFKGMFRPREIVRFADEFNSMAEELGSIEMLRADFINNFSHEFKTPIVSLKGFATLLKEKDLPPEKREEYLDIIISESDRLAALATNVLNLSKVEQQSILAEQDLFHLSEQIRRAVLLTESKWAKKDLSLQLEMEEIEYFGNADLLSQVWVNVLDNAIKFSPDGADLEVSLTDTGDAVVCTVRDHGLGMDAETRARIFDKFYQGDASRTTPGNGLGMSVVKKIVDLHQGKITIDSEPGQGTTVRISLPRQVEENKKKAAR